MIATMKDERLAGVLVGTAVGDALGLPFEGMSRRRVRRQLERGALRHRFLFGRGMVSDDTEQACLVARALLNSRAEPERFAGEACFPPGWVCGIAEWPCSLAWMKELSRCLALGSAPTPLPWLALLLRNVVFAFGVLLLVLRRATAVLKRERATLAVGVRRPRARRRASRG